MARSLLADSRRDAMQEASLLIASARQAMGLEEWTSSDTMREHCDDRGVLDSPNFARALGALKDRGVRLKDAGRKKEAKVNAVGFENAGTIVRRIAGGS